MFKPTLFLEILKLLPRSFVQDTARTYKSDHPKTKFKTHHHLVSMLYIHFSGVNSLRTLDISLGSSWFQSYHFGNFAPKRSTLSEANQDRDAGVFEMIFQKLLTFLPKGKTEDIHRKLKILDSTCISLKSRGHDWSKSTATSRCQGLKVHVGMEHEGSNLWFGTTTHANVNDITVAQNLALEEGSFYVFDKGYCDYNWWAKIHHSNAFFVTRLKKNAAHTVVKTHESQGVRCDQTIILTNKAPRGGKKNHLVGVPLRLVHVDHPSKPGETLSIVTNALHLSAKEIAHCYKKRWKIELLFKFLKQNVKIKKFIGESQNAILIQIYTALIAYVLLLIYQRLSNLKATLFEILTFVKANLMTLVTKIKAPPKYHSTYAQISFAF